MHNVLIITNYYTFMIWYISLAYGWKILRIFKIRLKPLNYYDQGFDEQKAYEDGKRGKILG